MENLKKQEKWNFAIQRAKELVGVKKTNQMAIAGIAMRACTISWGGSKYRNLYTLTKFAKEVGISARQLSTWVVVRRKVYDKLDPSITKTAKYTTLASLAYRVSNDATEEEVLLAYKQYSANKFESRILRYLGDIRAIAYNFEHQNAVNRVSRECLEETVFYCNTILNRIKEKHPNLKAADHNLAHKSSIGHMSAARAFGLHRNSTHKTNIRNREGSVISITPKDRDIVNFLKSKRNFVSPTEIGMELKGHNNSSASAWACRTLNKLIATELVERNKKGHYKWIN